MTFFGIGCIVLFILFVVSLCSAILIRNKKAENIISIIAICSLVLGVMFIFFDIKVTSGATNIIYPYLIMLATEIAFLIAIPFKCKNRISKIGFSGLTTSLCSFCTLVINCIIGSKMSAMESWISWSWFAINLCAAAILFFLLFLIHTSNNKEADNTGFVERNIQSTEDTSRQQMPDKSNNSSADEILKYKNLLDMGAITQEEYDKKKEQLLNI